MAPSARTGQTSTPASALKVNGSALKTGFWRFFHVCTACQTLSSADNPPRPRPGYTGRHCDSNIDECYSDPCHYGTCVDGLASFSCHCRAGYTGRLCETNINECLSQPCRNGGTCQDRENAYVCVCPKGTTGTRSNPIRSESGRIRFHPSDWNALLPKEPTAKSTLTTARATPATSARASTRSTATSAPASPATQVSAACSDWKTREVWRTFLLDLAGRNRCGLLTSSTLLRDKS